MGTHYKNGVPVPITRWEGSWAYEEQQRREAKKEAKRKEGERFDELVPKRHRLQDE